jgi:WD40 repeat protein
MYPRYLPSGHVVYVSKGTMFAVSFDLDRLEVRGSPKPILEGVVDLPAIGAAQMDFSKNGMVLYRTGWTFGKRTIHWLDKNGRTEPIRIEPGFYNYPVVAPDGSRIAAASSDGAKSTLWVYDLKRGGPIRLGDGSGVQSNPVWSVDGRYLVFRAEGGIWWARADGGNAPRILMKHPLMVPGSFSPDGKRLAVNETTQTGSMIYTAMIEDSSGQLRAGKPELFLQIAGDNARPSFSPDGRWLAYADTESGVYQVYVRPFPDGGTRVLISTMGGVYPTWSQSRNELFYRTEDNRLMVVNYTVSGESFVASTPRVWSQTPLASLGIAPNFDLAPDGERMAVLLPAEVPEPPDSLSHATLMLNFFAELRRRAGK